LAIVTLSMYAPECKTKHISWSFPQLAAGDYRPRSCGMRPCGWRSRLTGTLKTSHAAKAHPCRPCSFVSCSTGFLRAIRAANPHSFRTCSSRPAGMRTCLPAIPSTGCRRRASGPDPEASHLAQSDSCKPSALLSRIPGPAASHPASTGIRQPSALPIRIPAAPPHERASRPSLSTGTQAMSDAWPSSELPSSTLPS